MIEITEQEARAIISMVNFIEQDVTLEMGLDMVRAEEVELRGKLLRAMKPTVVPDPPVNPHAPEDDYQPAA